MDHLLLFFLVAHLLIIIFLSKPFVILASESTNKSEVDRQALLDFRQGITDPLGVLRSWRKDSLDFCSWRGVTCGKALPLRVISLELNSLGLAGQLSSSLANLTSITRLDLGNNSFSGPIPATLFSASSQLVFVDLEVNLFSGRIPDFPRMSTLRILRLAENSLSGKIPASLGNVSSLTEIFMYSNSLGGSIPETLSQIQNLSFLSLSENNLVGHVPAQLYNISSLVALA
ncbi:hypothetical protein U9M48_041030 [Paspalum notatum var. saurae]|uniref:Leucine-rich repeat-containing N-terminal plant-type domain-containing protein n=1 Tax=Paspalum notatum var. saurae TaxID=547442 RepID=A0AAQ3UPH7_PASNO